MYLITSWPFGSDQVSAFFEGLYISFTLRSLVISSMKSNSPIEVDVDKITESCAQVDGDEDSLSALCTNTEDTKDRSVVNGESYVSQAARTVSFGERPCQTVPVYNVSVLCDYSVFFVPCHSCVCAEGREGGVPRDKTCPKNLSYNVLDP